MSIKRVVVRVERGLPNEEGYRYVKGVMRITETNLDQQGLIDLLQGMELEEAGEDGGVRAHFHQA